MLAFPPFAAWPLLFATPVPLVLALEGRSARSGFALGLVHGLVFGLGVARWLVVALADQYGVGRAAAWTVTVGVVAPYAAVHAIAPAAWCALRPRLRPAATGLAFAALAALAEWLRAVPLGLPWLLGAQALAPVPWLVAPAALGGVVLAGLPPLLVGAGIGSAWALRTLRPLAPCLALAAAILAGGAALQLRARPEPSVKVGLVQAAVPQRERFQQGSARRNTRRHVALTRDLARREPGLDLVVWSETAVDEELGRDPSLTGLLRLASRAAQAPLISGAPLRDATGLRNAVVMVTPDEGVVERYDKQMLVPFSESDPPFAELLEPLLGPVLEGEPYAAGREATVFRRGPLPLSTPVCFEITDAALVGRFVDAGAQLLVNLSNDAWFGRSGYPRLHFDQAVLRAVEQGIWVVRVANTGVSGVIAPSGRVVASLGLFEEGVAAAEVAPRVGRTPYARSGDLPWVLALGVVVLVSRRGGRGAAPAA